MEQFSEAEKKRYYPQWVPDEKARGGGAVVATPEEHALKYPDHFEEWLTKLNPPPKSEEELNAAILAEREACIKFVDQYPTGQIFAKEIARALKKSRNSGVVDVVATGTLSKSTAKSRAATAAKHSGEQSLSEATAEAKVDPEPVLADV